MDETGRDRSPRVSRRDFLIGTAYAATAAVLAACGPTPTTPPPSPSPAPSPSPSPPRGPFEALEELRTALRTSPDHLPATAERLVASRDPAAIVRFVQERIASYPGGRASIGDPIATRRWGTRGTLRGGAGTPRERADLAVELLRRAGFEADVVELVGTVAAASLVHAAPRSAFDPAISDERLREIRTALGLAPDVPGPQDDDPGGRTAAALADALIDHFDSPPRTAEAFQFRDPTRVPAVRVVIDGTPHLARLDGPPGLQPAPDAPAAPARQGDDTLPVTVVLEAARSDEPAKRFTLVQGSWRAEDLVGRCLSVAFVPPVERLEELVAVSPRDVGVVIPVLAVGGPDVDAEESRRLSVAGEPITLSGEVVSVADDGSVRVGGRPIGAPTPDPERLAAVRHLTVVANPAAYPTIVLEVSATDADGAPITGLPASAFLLSEETTDLGFLLEQTSPPPPRVLILLDTSDSIPEDFRATGAAALARAVAEHLLAADPRVELRVAAVSFEFADPAGDWTSDPAAIEAQAGGASGYGSQLWESLANAGRLGATAIVFITDGRATDGSVEISEPPPGPLASVRAGPPTVVIGVGDIDPAMLEKLGQAGRLGAVRATNRDEAFAAIMAALDRESPPYRFRYRALPSGPEERRVQVRLRSAETAVSGETTYRVPPAEERATAPALSGLYLRVEMGSAHEIGSLTTERTLAGLRTDSPDAVVTAATTEAVRRALFGRYVLSFEAAAPPPSVVLDEIVSAVLAARPFVEATRRDERLAALAGIRFLPPPTYHALSIRLPAEGSKALTYEVGLRVTLHREVVLPTGDGRARRLRSVDILPQTRFATTDTDPVAAFRTTARRTARLAVAESVVFPTSTRTTLQEATLVPVRSSLYSTLEGIDRQLVDALAEAITPWAAFRPLALVPQAGRPTAAWLFDAQTGSLYGVLADGSGGGSEVEEIEDTFESARRVLGVADLLSNVAAFAGLGGFSFAGGVWLQLEQTKMEKLKAATLMLATLDPPDDDIADLSDLGCGVAQAVATEAVSAIAGHLAGEFGERAVAALSVADSVASLARGEGLFC
jgi:hypothetical protein